LAILYPSSPEITDKKLGYLPDNSHISYWHTYYWMNPHEREFTREFQQEAARSYSQYSTLSMQSNFRSLSGYLFDATLPLLKRGKKKKST
jgi:hypothetical protein